MLKVVKINAIWCSSCLYMNKIWNKILKSKEIETISLDYDFDNDKVKDYKPGNVLPIFIFLKDNKEVKRITGEISEKEMMKVIEELE